jgi:hypothetical protein
MNPKMSGLDGSVWTLETKKINKYYFDNTWSPGYGSIRNIGMHLIKMSGFEVNPEDIY